MSAANGPKWIKSLAKCSPGCTRLAYSAKVYKKSFEHEYQSESEVVVVSLFYHQHEVPVKEHVYAYDHFNLIADIGGYLGLLLGYSILAFYDMLVYVIEKVACTKKSPKAQNHVG